jgi:hypothetical protein
MASGIVSDSHSVYTVEKAHTGIHSGPIITGVSYEITYKNLPLVVHYLYIILFFVFTKNEYNYRIKTLRYSNDFPLFLQVVIFQVLMGGKYYSKFFILYNLYKLNSITFNNF